MALNKSILLKNSRSSAGTEMEQTVNTLHKIRSISSASLYHKYIKKQQPKDIKISNDILLSGTPSVFCRSVHGTGIPTVSTKKYLILRKYKREIKNRS